MGEVVGGNCSARRLPSSWEVRKRFGNRLLQICVTTTMNEVPLLHATAANMTRRFASLPATFIKDVLVEIHSCSTHPQDVDDAWCIARLLHEIEDIGLELFIQKLDAETVHESCSVLNLGANEEEV